MTATPGPSFLQLVDRPGILDLSWGHPALELLPADELQGAAATALDRHGADALGYGRDAGPLPFRELVRARLESTDLRAPLVDEIVVTAGASHALDLTATLLTSPGDVVLVESPTYHLAVRILRDHPIDLVAVPFDGGGLRVDALGETLARLRASGRRPRVLYTIATFHNPTGATLLDDRRRELVELAATEGLVIVEDDVYRELAYDGPPPASLWSIAQPGVVVRLGSFSKSLAPGLRLGYLTADGPTAARIAGAGLLESGGGIAHFQALVVAAYAASGGYGAHVEVLRTAYRARRDALLASLERHLPAGASWTVPRGGYFTWATLPSRLDAEELLPAAEARGVSYVPGRRFYIDGESGRSALRLAFSRYTPAELGEAARRLGLAVRDTLRSR
jgi:2-aminoadipate transaminase